MSLDRTLSLALTLPLAIVVFGCGQSSEKVSLAIPAAHEVAEHPHNHEGWWCDEHGVPEEVCAQCNFKLAAEFKAKGDWCKLHDRPDSQCFICHPEKEAEFAAQYEAKYGKQPPKRHQDAEEQANHRAPRKS